MANASTETKIEDLAWMAGSWRCEIWGGEFEEHWSSPEGGTMVGMGRHLLEGRTKFMEFLSIEPSDAGLTMWTILGSPSKSPKTGMPFELASFDGTTAVFTNSKNPYPSRIVYRRTETTMTC